MFTVTISGKRRAHDRVKKSNGRRQQISIQEFNFLPAKSEGTASISNRLKYFNKGNYDLSKSRGTKHSYSREADDYCKTQTTDNDVYYNADISLEETVAEDRDISWRDGRRLN